MIDSQGGCHIVALYIVMYASYRGLSYKSALDVWSLCTSVLSLDRGRSCSL